MINKDNLNKMYDILIGGYKITNDNLNSCGFDINDIDKLIENGVLKKTQKDIYEFLSINDLLLYGKELSIQKNYKKANACFEKCYSLCPNNYKLCAELFMKKLRTSKYEESIEYFEYLYNNEEYKPNKNLYLYLLSMLTEVPEKYKEKARNLKFKDIKITDDNIENLCLKNTIRFSIFYRKFRLAGRQLEELIKLEGSNIYNRIIYVLIEQSIKEHNLAIDKKLELVKNKQYQEYIDYILLLETRYKLLPYDKYSLMLAKDLIDIINGKMVEMKKSKSTNIFKVIESKDYKKALNMNEEYLKKENKKIDKNIIHILLLEITKMIEKNPKESNQNYVIDNIESLVSLVLSGTLIEEVCIKFNLNEEQKCIILLMCAKNLYLQGNILSGDQYLKQAEKIKSKSKKVKDLLEEIKTNREFYQNIIKEDYKPLVLK